MDRSRLPSPLAAAHLITRCIALLVAHAALTVAIYLSIKHNSTHPVLYGALLWTDIIDSAEILALTSKPEDSIRHAPYWVLLLWEGVGVALYSVSYTVTYDMSGTSNVSEKERESWNEASRQNWNAREKYITRLWQLVLLEIVLRAISMVICAIDAWRPVTRLYTQHHRHQYGGVFRTLGSIHAYHRDYRRRQP